MKATSQAGFVLHSRPYRDSSALTELFSDEYGRIGLVVRGARRKNSRTRLAVTPLQELLLSWTGRGELYTLTDVEQKTLVPRITGKRLASSFYINELLMRLLHRNDPHPGLYAAYRTTLLSLADSSQDINQILRLFEKRLLDELGYGLVLETTVDTNEPLIDNQRYTYHVEHGPVSIVDNEGAAPVIHGATLAALQREVLTDEQCLREARQLMRYVLQHYLGNYQLKSRFLLDTVL